jgi:hypothetical protein
MSSIFLLLSFIGILLVAFWSIEQERELPEERGYSGWFGLKRHARLPPPPPKKSRFARANRPAAEAPAMPERIAEDDLKSFFQKPPRNRA